ncbi:MAG: sensor histidine kinase [Sphingomicrobium sp.]
MIDLLRWRRATPPSRRNIATGVGAGLLVLALAVVADQHGRPVTAALLALFSVTIVGATLGVRGGLVAGILASFAYNLLLTEPILTFTPPSSDDLLPILALNVCAIASGIIAGRLRDRATAAELSRRLVADLLAFSQALQPAATLEQIEDVAVRHIGRGGPVALFIEIDGSLRSPTGSVAGAELAAEVFHGGMHELRSSEHLALALASAERRIGVVVVDATHDEVAGQDIRNFLPLLALAVERSLLAAELSEAEAIKWSEKFKTALLSSVSHDLRTPLAAISASASSLSSLSAELDRGTKNDLLRTIQEQCERLDRLTTNLLNIGRIEGGLEVEHMPFVDAVEVLGSALGKVRQLHSTHRFDKDFRAGFATVRADEPLLEQVFINVLENAAVHTAPGTRVKVSSECSDRSVVISIEDDGSGIPERERGRIFDRFVQGTSERRSHSGSGLGLSIARGFAERVGGTIQVASAAAPLKGAKIEIRLPVAQQ